MKDSKDINERPTTKNSVVPFVVGIPNVKRKGRPKKKLGQVVRRKSYMKKRSAALRHASKDTPSSRYLLGSPSAVLPISNVVQMISSAECTIGNMLALEARLPSSIESDIRNVVVASTKDDLEGIAQATTLGSDIIRFTLPRVSHHLQSIRRRIESKDPVGTEINIDGQEQAADRYGVLLEICEFKGPNNSISESSSVFISYKSLCDMKKVAELVTLLHKSSSLFIWLQEIGTDHELCEPTKKEVRGWANYARSELLNAHPFRNLGDGRELSFNMGSLLRLRGTIRISRPLWLDSDCISIALCRIQDSVRRGLRDRIYFLPPYPWTDTAAVGSRMYDPSVTYKLLEDAEHPLLALDSKELRRSLVYTVANVSNAHWVALEACLATKRICIYDPAEKGGFDLPRSEICDRFVSFFAELSVRKCVPWLAEPWRIRQTLGGQQEFAKDAVNCGVISTEWISFRINSDVFLRWSKGMEHAKDTLRECRMRGRAPYQWDLVRLQILHYAARNASILKGKQ